MIPFASSIRLHCEYMALDFGDIVGNLYSCQLDNLVIQTPDMLIDGDDGEHLIQRSFDDVKAINVSKSHFYYIPKGFGKIFKNIEAIEVRKSSLKVLTKEDLQQFQKLKALWLEGNMLQSLDSDLFQFNPEIKIISFAGNKINFIATNIFDSKDLEKVDLSNNVCIKSAKAQKRSEIEEVRRKIVESCQRSGGLSKNANPVIVTSVLMLIAFCARSFVV